MEDFLHNVLMVVLGLLGLSFLVFIHEFGHFIVAKWNGVRVKTFSIGFGKKLLKFRKGETEYCISLVPFGGYVAMAGENPEGEGEGEEVSDLEERGFASKSVGARASIAFAGPFVNILFAFLLLIVLYMKGVEEPLSNDLVVGFTIPNEPAAMAGVLPGDTITAIDGEPTKGWDDFRERIGVSLGANLVLTVRRDSGVVQIPVVPTELVIPALDSLDSPTPMGIGDIGVYPRHRVVVQGAPWEGSNAAKAGIMQNDTIFEIDGHKIFRYEDVSKIVNASAGDSLHFTLLRGADTLHKTMVATYNEEYKRYMVGIQLGYVMFKETHIVKRGFVESVQKSAATNWKMTTSIFRYFKRLFQGQVKVDAFSGPVTIVAAMGNVWVSGFHQFLMFLALISINLGVMNLLPLAVTDGGLLMFLAIEKVRGKPLSQKAQALIQRIAFSFFLAFFIFITFLDLGKVGLFFR